MYANGDGVAQDDAQAVRLMRKAATQGHRQATFGLGVMYAEGRGVPRNLEAAFALISAIASPDEEMTQYRGMLLTHMPPGQRERAERLADELRATGVSEATMRRLAPESDGQPAS